MLEKPTRIIFWEGIMGFCLQPGQPAGLMASRSNKSSSDHRHVRVLSSLASSFPSTSNEGRHKIRKYFNIMKWKYQWFSWRKLRFILFVSILLHWRKFPDFWLFLIWIVPAEWVSGCVPRPRQDPGLTVASICSAHWESCRPNLFYKVVWAN